MYYTIKGHYIFKLSEFVTEEMLDNVRVVMDDTKCDIEIGEGYEFVIRLEAPHGYYSRSALIAIGKAHAEAIAGGKLSQYDPFLMSFFDVVAEVDFIDTAADDIEHMVHVGKDYARSAAKFIKKCWNKLVSFGKRIAVKFKREEAAA